MNPSPPPRAELENYSEQSAPTDILRARREELFARIEPRGTREFTARERVELLLDRETFVETTPLVGGSQSGVVTGWGLVDGRKVTVVSHDASVSSGAIGKTMAEAIVRAQKFAIKHLMPIVFLNDSGGARVPDGVLALHGCGEMFALNVAAQNLIPQISVILGPCAGAAAYSPALTDWTIMVKGQGHMFLTGPEIVRSATGEDVTADEIGGSRMHTKNSGVAHLEVESEEEALQAVSHLLSYLPSSSSSPQNVGHPVPVNESASVALPHIVPTKASVVFDINEVIDGIFDNGARMELMPDHAGSAVTMFGRIEGRPVGIVANQPAARGGILDSKASVKIARFVEFCGRFGLPIITLVDVPGFLPGTTEEERGIITHGAKMLKAYANARSPKLTVILRKAYGGAYIAMGSTSIGADAAWAWANAEIAVMGPGGAVGLLHRKALAASDDPAKLRDELAAEYREQVARPYVAAEAGIVEDVIYPEETRVVLSSALKLWESK